MTRNELWKQIERRVADGWWLLSCDLGHPHIERLMAEYPDRALNVGIAEQSACGIATGLAVCGHRVMVYGIGCQVVMRACEQLHFAKLNGLSFIVIGIGHGDYYHNAGPSHDSNLAMPIVNALGLRYGSAWIDPREHKAPYYIPVK